MCRLCAYPSGQAVNEQRRTHCDDEYNDDADDEIFDHVASVDFFLVAVRDGNFNADIRTPNNDDRRESDDDIDPKTVDRAMTI